ncbi:MAG TPA: type II secretion system minor pseudopilin GspI [Candidatus Kapabacteria bacterium]|nr:type II secretion system minor pseudopilin GspI [Candidatus Kapabacteria bacterium]
MKKKSDGFTLIEVMIALAIFAVAMGALMSTVRNNLNTVTGLQNRTMAQWIASNQLVRYHAINAQMPVADRKDKLTYAGREWAIRTVVIKKTDSINEVNISVGEKVGREENYYTTLTGYLSNVD